jgi:hypothetical protein
MFLCPILELRLTGLESVGVVLVDVEHVRSRLKLGQQVIA